MFQNNLPYPSVKTSVIILYKIPPDVTYVSYSTLILFCNGIKYHNFENIRWILGLKLTTNHGVNTRIDWIIDGYCKVQVHTNLLIWVFSTQCVMKVLICLLEFINHLKSTRGFLPECYVWTEWNIKTCYLLILIKPCLNVV